MKREPARRGSVRAVILLTLLAVASAPPEPAGAAATLPLLVAAASKVDRVIVYSDQARVFRRAKVELRGGAAKVHLGGLPDAALRDTVRVTCSGAEVLGVEVSWSREQLVRQQQAKQLLERLEQLQDRARTLDDEREVLEGEIAIVDALRLGRLPAPERRGFAIGLFAGAWRQILSWSEARIARARARLAQIAETRHQLSRDLHGAQVDAKGFDLQRVTEPSWNVVAALKGAGQQTITVSYLVRGPRWIPSYDLRYDAESRTVEAAYYALVRQSTGEDWDKAQLRFSTSQPTALLAVPELPTWTLGRKRDFMPTPRPRADPAPQRWEPDPAAVPLDPLVQRLREALAVAAGAPTTGTTKGDVDRDADGVQDEEDADVDKREAEKKPYAYRPRPPARRRAASPLDDLVRLEGRAAAAPPAQAPPPPAPSAAPAEPMEAEVAADEAPARTSVGSVLAKTVSRGWGRSTPQEQVPWTDVGYQPPLVDRDLPAAAAEGYRYTLYAPGRHSVPANGEDRRIPLVRHRLAVKPVHHIVPGRSEAAYLTAELKNTTGRPILRGHAHLFAGAMFSGKSWLNTALPGRSLKLPLGVDDHVKVVRHTRQQTVVEGVVFKDDVSAYTVEIEVANNHRYPIRVELEDQIPLQSGDDVEVKAFSAKPQMSKPDKQGRVRWQGKVAAGRVQKLSFSFQIVRPKDYELQQHGG